MPTVLQVVRAAGPIRLGVISSHYRLSHITSLKSTTVHIAVPLHLNPACLSLRKGPSMKPSELFEALHALITERVPLHIWARAVWASHRSLRRSPLI
jgi:N6-adenosine-specific RNA methylase IME4